MNMDINQLHAFRVLLKEYMEICSANKHLS